MACLIEFFTSFLSISDTYISFFIYYLFVSFLKKTFSIVTNRYFVDKYFPVFRNVFNITFTTGYNYTYQHIY